MAIKATEGEGRDLLIVDDDLGQIRLFRILLEDLDLPHRCFHASNGHDALRFVRRQPPYQNAPRPELIMLDLNMPGMDGCDFLREIKRDSDLSRIPVIIFSSTNDQREITRCYEENANACIQKPSDYEASLEVVRGIENFWFRTATLPNTLDDGDDARQRPAESEPATEPVSTDYLKAPMQVRSNREFQG
jgi:two-component system, chemotaxis family, response regulator Rcp1